MNTDLSILTSIKQLLDENSVEYTETSHEPTFTSEQSASARGESLAAGGKALLLKCDHEFVLFVLPADRKLSSKKVKSVLRVRKLRFATQEELREKTGLVPGAVPPFGHPILSFRLFADNSLCEREGPIAFNAGSLNHSVVMPVENWIQVAQPTFISLVTDL